MQAAGAWRRAAAPGALHRRECSARPVFGQAAPGARVASRRAARQLKVSVAAAEAASEATAQAPATGVSSQQTPSVADIPDLNVGDLEVEELDAAQEQLLAWMMTNNEEEQEQDLDEMVDYDEFGDDEYEELHETVEGMIEESVTDIMVGDTILGRVYLVDEEGAYVEVGEKGTGFVPLAECSFAKLKTPLEALRVGMVREFAVLQQENREGQMVLSLAALEASVYWQRMRQLMAEGAVVRVRVEGANKGGLAVKYGPLDGFITIGQFGQAVTLVDMEAMIGQYLDVKFVEVDEVNERLLFSAKQARGAALPAQDIQAGDVLPGTVQMVKPYGVFVDLGGSTGLLHVSQITNQRITSVDKLFREGDKIKVMVLGLDRDRGRITLSTKRLEQSPGDMLKDPQSVYETAEEMGVQYRQRIEMANAMKMESTELASIEE